MPVTCCARACCSCPRAAASARWSRRHRSAAASSARFVAGRATEDAVAAPRPSCADQPARHHRLPRRGHPRPGPGAGHPRRLRAAAAALAEAGLTQDGRAEVSVKLQRRRPGAARRRREDRARARPRDLQAAAQRRHDGDPRHGGPHHHRLDAGDPARAAPGLPVGRRGPAGLPAPHRGRLPRPGRRGQPGPAVQGRLQGARVGGVPGLGTRSTSPTCAA